MCIIHPFFDAIPVHYICHMEPKFLENILCEISHISQYGFKEYAKQQNVY